VAAWWLVANNGGRAGAARVRANPQVRAEFVEEALATKQIRAR